MKVYYWTPYMGNVGTIKATINSAAALKKRGHEVKLYKLFHEWEGYEDLLQQYGIEVVDFGLSKKWKSLPSKGIGFRISMIRLSVASFGKLKRNWNEEKPDIVIASLLGYLPLLARRSSSYKPIIVNSIQGRPRLHALRRLLWKLQYSDSDLLVTLSDETQKEIHGKLGFPENKIVRIDNPVIDGEIHRMAQEEPEQSYPEGFILGVGRLTRQKDFTTLIEAFSRLKDYQGKLVILGDGEDKEKLSHRISELQLSDRVELKGFVKNPYCYMKRADAFVLSSLWEDAGHVLLEAAYVKAPIVSTRCPSGQEEFLDYGEGGELCEAGDPVDMAKKIEAVLSRNNQNKIERAYRKSLNYTMDIHGKRLEAALEGLLG